MILLHILLLRRVIILRLRRIRNNCLLGFIFLPSALNTNDFENENENENYNILLLLEFLPTLNTWTCSYIEKTVIMGAVVSCVCFPFPILFPLHPPTSPSLFGIAHIYVWNNTNITYIQIASIFHAIGACLMGIVNTIGAVCKAIIDGVVTLFDVIISCLTCGGCGGRRRRTRRSRVWYRWETPGVRLMIHDGIAMT